MPTIANISIEIHAPYNDDRGKGGGSLHEYPPHSQRDRKSHHNDGEGIIPEGELESLVGADDNEAVFMPRLWDSDTRTLSVFVEMPMGAQWWIVYKAGELGEAVLNDLTKEMLQNISSAQGKARELEEIRRRGKIYDPLLEVSHDLRKRNGIPRDNTGKDDAALVDEDSKGVSSLFWVFQLYIGKQHVDTWSVGENRSSFQGKVQFVLNKDKVFANKPAVLYKRTFRFSPQFDDRAHDMERKIEVRAFRAYIALRCRRVAGASSQKADLQAR
jgi:hypothetical protein